jgi:hypothetical protein
MPPDVTHSALRTAFATTSRWYAVTACLALGCDGNGQGSGSLILCDGSDDVRFAYGRGLGAREPLQAFGAANGTEYVAIDGRCRFWIYDMTLQGLRTGLLAPEYANSQLANELHLGLYSELADPSVNVCLDGGGEWAWDTTGSISTSCGVTGERGTFADTLTRAAELLPELAQRSTPAWDHVYLLPLLGAERPAAIPATEWTSDLDLSPHAVSWVDYTNGLVRDAGLLVEDAPTLSMLSELRIAGDQLIRSNPRELNASWYPGLFLSDPRVGELQVLLRDEPPSSVSKVLRSRGGTP